LEQLGLCPAAALCHSLINFLTLSIMRFWFGDRQTVIYSKNIQKKYILLLRFITFFIMNHATDNRAKSQQ
jgi:hypothetical protein